MPPTMFIIAIALVFSTGVYCDVTGEATDDKISNERLVPMNAEGRLLAEILINNNYNKRERPINISSGYSNGSVEVVMALSIQALQGVNERIQMLTIASWITLEWQDYRLAWDPSRFAGINRISLPTRDIWAPRIVLENTANRKLQLPGMEEFSRVVVSHSGVILYDTPEVLSSLCSIDVAGFPFDVQNCSLDFTNQADTTDLVVLKVSPDLTHSYQYDRTQWMLIRVTTSESILIDSYNLSGVMSFSYVHFHVELRRLPFYHLTTSALPSTVLTVLGFTVFWLPPECGEKITLGVSLLLGLTVFQLVVSAELPEKSAGAPPLLGMYLNMNFSLVAASVFCTAVSLGVYSQPGPIRNRCVRGIFLHFLPSVFLVRRPQRQASHEKAQMHVIMEETESDRGDPESSEKQSRNNQIETIVYQEEDEGPETWRDERWIITVVLDRIFFLLMFMVYAITTSVLYIMIPGDSSSV